MYGILYNLARPHYPGLASGWPGLTFGLRFGLAPMFGLASKIGLASNLLSAKNVGLKLIFIFSSHI